MSQPRSGDSPFRPEDEPARPPRKTRKKESRKAPSEAELKKALAEDLVRYGREQADRQAEWDATPPRRRTGGFLLEHGRLIGSGLCVLIGLFGVAVCAGLNMPMPFFILPGIFLLIAVIGFVYTWFGLNQ
jgi:hypothetical protein